MSDVDDDVAEQGREALRTSRVEPLEERLRAFVAEHDRENELKRLRREASGGTPLSDLVDAGRIERE